MSADYDPLYVPRAGDRITLFWTGVDLADTPRSWDIRGRVVDVDPQGDMFRVKGREQRTRQRVDKWFSVDAVANEFRQIRQATYRRNRFGL